MLDLSNIEIVDFHSHTPRRCNISQVIKMGEENRDFFVSLGKGPQVSHEKGLLRYLASVYGCKPTVEAIDNEITQCIENDFYGYVESILDREKISLANLDLWGGKEVGEARVYSNLNPLNGKDKVYFPEDFPRNRMKWIYQMTPIIQPQWAAERGAKSIDQVLDLIYDELDDAVKKGCAAFKSMIAYYRTPSMEQVDQTAANVAFKELLEAKPKAFFTAFLSKVPLYDDLRTNNSLKKYQDFLIRNFLIRAGELDRPVQFHCASIEDPSCDQRFENPENFFSMFYDEKIMQKTTICILHMGYPWYHQAAVIPLQFYRTGKIYIDTSYINHYPPIFRDVMKNVLTFTPIDRITYGSDAFSIAERFGYYAWMTRRVLTDVLEELRTEFEWTEEDCLEAAEMILNKNAKTLLKI